MRALIYGIIWGGGGGRDNAKWNAGLKQLKNSKTEDGIERTKNMKM